MSDRLYAPNVHLFAFHLRESEDDPDQLWKHYHQEIVLKFALSPSLELIDSHPEGRRTELWKEAEEDNVLLFIEGKISNQQQITGCVCPLFIYDSYALALNLRIPERDAQDKSTPLVESSIFKDFNPAGCLSPQSFQSNLGQTILLTAWLLPEHQKQRKDWKAIAQDILTNFLADSSQECPPLYQSGHLFDNPIFEYGSPQYPDKNGRIVHYLVWLFINDSADSNLGIIYHDLIDLFFYRHKITTIYQDNVSYLTDIKIKYKQIRADFLAISTQLPDVSRVLSKQELYQFKQNLKALPKLDIDYTDQLRKFRNNHLTLKINQENYQEKLNRIQNNFPSQDLSFLSQFGTKVALKLQQQIELELDYFGNGSSLADKAIASIRAIVEIEQAERDRVLQDHIQAIGVGIAAGAIVASSSGLMTVKPWSLPDPQQWFKPPHPMVIAVFVSSFIAWIAWKIAKRWINWQRQDW